MSKASEWAARVREVREREYAVRQERPGYYAIALSPSQSIRFGLDDEGRPQINCDKAWNSTTEPEVLVGLAKWLIDTFSDTPTP